MSLIKILIDTGDNSFSELDGLQSRKESLPKIINYLQALNSGAKSAEFVINIEPVQKVSTLTLTGTGQVEDETFTLNGVEFTLKDDLAAGYTGLWVDLDHEDEEVSATNIAACVNGAHAQAQLALNGVVGASSLGAVVTFTAVEGGKVGNAITLTDAATDAESASGASGTNGTSTTISEG
jgi:hypothetical protein